MRRRRYSTKFNPATATLPALMRKVKEVEEKISKLESELLPIDFTRIINEYENLNKQMYTLDHKINELRLVRRRKEGILSAIFGEMETTPEALEKIKNIEKEKIKIQQDQEMLRYNDAIKQRAILPDIKRKKEYLKKLEPYIEALQKKKNKITDLKVKAAQNAKERRIMAAALKRGLKENKYCPYCESDLSNGGHIDHIYPVSKGGQSVIENMVFVCTQCNLKKGNLTLLMFIKKYELKRDKIEQALSNLKKEF